LFVFLLAFAKSLFDFNLMLTVPKSFFLSEVFFTLFVLIVCFTIRVAFRILFPKILLQKSPIKIAQGLTKCNLRQNRTSRGEKDL